MNNLRQICLHLSAWALILLFFLVFGSEGLTMIKYDMVVIIVYFGIVNILVFYINYLYILPTFLNEKRYVRLIISLFFLLTLSALVKYGMSVHFKDTLQRSVKAHHYSLTFAEYFSGSVLVSAFFAFLSSALRFGVDWFTHEKLRKELENQKLLAELAFLRSQINPHFLFNSLNNIYSLAYQRSDKAPEAILKLSEMMRYMLNESNESFVPLKKEITYLKSYIELQKLRFKENTFVDLSIEGEAFDDQKIASFILIAFVENAFKHGRANDPSAPIIIGCKIEPGVLTFKVSNSKADQNKDRVGGIGMHNVKRRLDLIYGKNYGLEIVNNANHYSCKLSLVL